MAADELITQLAAMASWATDDLVVVVDVHDATMAPSGTDKRATLAALFAQLTGDVGVAGFTATVAHVNGVAYPAAPPTNTVPVVTGANAVTYEAVPNAALANSSITINTAGTITGGGAVSLGGSITLTGSGGGSTLAPTAVKTTTYAAAVGDYVRCSTAGGGFTVTLPTTPADGSQVAVAIVTDQPPPNNTALLTIACGGTDVLEQPGGVASATMGPAGSMVLLQYHASDGTWVVIERRLPPWVQSFTSSATWTRTTWAERVDVLGMGSGGGGMSGPAVASGTATAGGGAGSGGAFAQATYAASDLPATVPVTVAAGGTGSIFGGAASTAGTTSTFGTYLAAGGGNRSAGSSGGSAPGGLYNASAGASATSGAGGSNGGGPPAPSLGGQGGGSGGGITTTPGATPGGGTGGFSSIVVVAAASGGAVNTSGNNGGSITGLAYAPYAGQGGCGGGSSITGNGGNGGNGGNYGGGGAGGGAALTPNSGGNGGNGGAGILVVITS